MKTLALFCLIFVHSMTTSPVLYAPLEGYVRNRVSEFGQISAERKEDLQLVADYIIAKQKQHQPVRLLFVCTHNSRRSHMSQIWARAAATYYGLQNIETYSGGTEVSAFNPRAVAALSRAGFTIRPQTAEANPRYDVYLADAVQPLVCFSKKYNDAANPHQQFCAVMTCSQADAACPFVAGADGRMSVPYDDPKVADGTPQEAARYDERCAQIAREMLWVMHTVAQAQ